MSDASLLNPHTGPNQFSRATIRGVAAPPDVNYNEGDLAANVATRSFRVAGLRTIENVRLQVRPAAAPNNDGFSISWDQPNTVGNLVAYRIHGNAAAPGDGDPLREPVIGDAVNIGAAGFNLSIEFVAEGT
jgi:hypothetical protein